MVKNYPDTPLKKQVRSYEETLSVWTIMYKYFFGDKKEKDNEDS